MSETNVKIITIDDLDSITPSVLKKTTILAGGCFDVVHFGHIRFLHQMKERADITIIMLEPDETVRIKKKRDTVHTQDQRAQMLAALRDVDVVVCLPHLQRDAEYANIVKQIHPTYIALTEGDPLLSIKKEHADSVGAQIIRIAKVNTPSTSTIRGSLMR